MITKKIIVEFRHNAILSFPQKAQELWQPIVENYTSYTLNDNVLGLRSGTCQ